MRAPYLRHPREEDAEPIPGAAELAEQLESLQAPLNGGRGIRLVRDIALYLRRGDFLSATVGARTDSDKLQAYPEVERLVNEAVLTTRWDREMRRSVYGNEWGAPSRAPSHQERSRL